MSDHAQSLVAQARQARKDQRPIEARDLYQRAADRARAAGDQLMLLHILRHLSEMDREVGALERALIHGEEAVALCRATAGATALDLANAERVRALAHLLLGHAAAASDGWRAARALYAQLGIDAGVAEADQQLASMAGGAGGAKAG